MSACLKAGADDRCVLLRAQQEECFHRSRDLNDDSLLRMSAPDLELTRRDCQNAAVTVSELLLQHAEPEGHWTGHLSSSALSTATALMALELSRKNGITRLPAARVAQLIQDGQDWLRSHQNSDGGWGDTDLSISNISTTMLCHAALHACDSGGENSAALAAAQDCIDHMGGVQAVLSRYGSDRTFSIPILTHCALAGTVDWKHVLPLPFELSCLPAGFYAALRLPVVSYALPALIAIGQAVFHHRGHWNPLVKSIRRAAIEPSLKVLQRIQPSNGGFLEATPLTSFVCMSLVSCGRGDGPVAGRCLDFIAASARSDGSWPIDTNLTTWVTTLSVNALATGDQPHPELDSVRRKVLTDWLLSQQLRDKHPYTNADPGGWSWSNLPGAVPDADDTPGAMLALLNLNPESERMPEHVANALDRSTIWLLSLQNRDGGWPTFCRGWGRMPFDRSSNDLTAHVLRALHLWMHRRRADDTIQRDISRASQRGLKFLGQRQSSEGSWLPLWFGHQFAEEEENPLYGTAKVLQAYTTLGQQDCHQAKLGLKWLLSNQNADGGWSARRGLQSSVEETGLALEAICGFSHTGQAAAGGTQWLTDRLSTGAVQQPTPIGFYFAKLWYYERLYPLIFATAGLRAATRMI